ncbi:MAG TPA: SAM-dependent methyltransferase [Stenomitos sp.]
MTRRDILERALDEAAASGPMTFRTYMDLALYHPEGGYYTRPEMRVGVGGDFHTSPTLSPAFGHCVARQLGQFWELMGKPAEFQLLEIGAGSGQLADQILGGLARDRRWKRLTYQIVEKSPALRERQRATLQAYAGTVRWAEDLPDLAPDGAWQGVVLSNELFDAFPVHRVIGLKEGFAEIGVMRHEKGYWRQIGIVPTTPRLAEYLAAEGITLQEGQQAEINLAALDMMERLGRWLGRGFVLTIDYGGPADYVYAPHRRKGTIRGYYKQLAIRDPLEHPGEQDLTSDVDFTALMRAAEGVGLRTVGVVPQGTFLKHLGIEALEKEALRGVKGSLEADFAASDIRKLYDPRAMGEGFSVLVQAKGVTVAPEAVLGLTGGQRGMRWPWKRP